MFWIGWILCPQRHLRIPSKSKSYTIPSDALALSSNFLSTALTPSKSQNFMALNYWKNIADGSGCHSATMVMDNIRTQCSIVWQTDPGLDTKKNGREREEERERALTNLLVLTSHWCWLVGQNMFWTWESWQSLKNHTLGDVELCSRRETGKLEN